MKKLIEKIVNFFKGISLRTWIEIALYAVLIVGIIILFQKYKTLNEDYKTARNNEKAYEQKYNSATDENRVFKFTIDQLQQTNDSIVDALYNKSKELKIKDKELQRMGNLLSEYSKKDTVMIVDTIFKDPELHIDTLIGDQWMSTHMELIYPNTICLESKAMSDKDVIIYSSRETVNPPKKCFIGRWFQKKHTVIKVVVEENNPYINSEENTFIEVVK